MRISKPAVRKPGLHPPSLLQAAAALASPADVPDAALCATLAPLLAADWPWQKCDMHLWIPVLNRLDAVLARLVAAYGLVAPTSTAPTLTAPTLTAPTTTPTPTASPTPTPTPVQARPFDPADKALVQAILAFCKALWENSTNRSIFNSYEHLAALLGSTDLDVVLDVLRFLLKPAQRAQSQRSLRANFSLALDRIHVLAQKWLGAKEFGLDLANLAGPDDLPIPEELLTVRYEFYRVSSASGSPSAAAAAAPSGIMPPPAPTSLGSAPDRTPARHAASSSGTPAYPPSAASAASGVSAATPFATPATPAAPGSAAFSDVSGSFPKTPKTPKTPSPFADAPFKTPANHGLVAFAIPPAAWAEKSDAQLLEELKTQHNVPDEHLFPLFNRIRIAMNLRNASRRRALLTIRVHAIAVLAYIVPEDQAQSKLFLYEPDLVQRLADLISTSADGAGLDETIQAAAAYALDAMAAYRSKFNDVLAAINLAANHGPFMQALRRVLRAMETNTATAGSDYVDAVFTSITYLSSTAAGCNMLQSAGVVPLLVSAATIPHAAQTKHIARCINMLDSILYSSPASFGPFTAANGVEIHVNRIRDDVQACINLASGIDVSTFAPGAVIDPCASPSFKELAQRVPVLRATLKLGFHTMQTSGTVDGMRSLIDSSLPQSLRAIFDHSRLFGFLTVFGLAVNIMSTFIHNEPTTLAILQEARITHAFLLAAQAELPASAEVVSALPNAFGAICLNEAGIEEFRKHNPLDRFLSVFTSEDHIRALKDNDVPNLVGNAIDEFIRHHPSLKETVLTGVVKMFDRIADVGESLELTHDEADACFLFTGDASASAATADVPMVDAETGKKAPKPDHRMVLFIETATRFLEGVFQNVSHSKEFIRLGGVAPLLRLFTLRTVPHDFSSIQASFSMSYAFKVMIETNPQEVMAAILKQMNVAFDRAEPFVAYSGPGSLAFKYVFMGATEPSPADASASAAAAMPLPGSVPALSPDDVQVVFRSLVTLLAMCRLLSDLFCTHAISHTKAVVAITNTFVGEHGEKLIERLGRLFRACIWERMLLASLVPEAWYAKKDDAAASGADQVSSKVAELGMGATAAEIAATLAESASTAGAPTPLDEAMPMHQDTAHVSAASGSGPEPAAAGLSSATAVVKASSALAASAADAESTPAKNARLMWHVIEQIPALLGAVFKSILKLVCGRRGAESSNRALMQSIVNQIAQFSLDNLTWSRPQSIAPAAKMHLYDYTGLCLALVVTLITDERNTVVLQTMDWFAFEKAGGLDYILRLVEELVADGKTLADSAASAHLTAKEIEQTKTHLQVTLETIMVVLQHITNAKMLHDSSHTAQMVARQREKPSPETFDAHAYLVHTRLRVAPAVLRILPDPFVHTSSAPVLAGIMMVLSQILQAEGEEAPRVNPAAATPASNLARGINAINAQFGMPTAPPAPVVADPDKVNQLVDMGFPRPAAEAALIRCSNNIARAAEYLLAHPHFITANMAPPPPPASSATTATPQTAGSSAVASATTATPVTPAAAGSSGASASATATASTSTAAPVAATETAAEAATIPAGQEDVSMSVAADPASSTMDDDDDDDEAALLSQAIAMSNTAQEDPMEVSSTTVAPAASGSADTSESQSSAAASGVAPMDTSAAPPAPAAATSDAKGKGKAPEAAASDASAEDRAKLNELREQIKKDGEKFVFSLLGVAEDTPIFNIKDFVCLLGKDDLAPLLKMLLKEIDEIKDTLFSITKAYSPLGSRLRLLLLLAMERAHQRLVLEQSHGLVVQLIALIAQGKPTAGIGLSSALLLIETYMTVLDEPLEEEFKFTPEGQTPSSPVPARLPAIPDESLVHLVEGIIGLYATDGLDPSTLHAAYRLLVILTRRRNLASKFVESGGLAALLGVTYLSTFASQQSLSVIIIRHLVESEPIVDEIIDRQVKAWLHTPRLRAVDLNTYIKSNIHLCLRDVDSFVRATDVYSKLSRVDAKARIAQISRLPTPEEVEAAAAPASASSASAPAGPETSAMDTSEEASAAAGPSSAVASAAATPGPSAPATPAPVPSTPGPATSVGARTPAKTPGVHLDSFAEENLSSSAGPVVQYLVHELLSLRAQPPAPLDPKTNEPVPIGKADHKDPRFATHIRRLAILQCLSELVISYPVCKLDVLHASQKRNSGKTPQRGGKNPLLIHVLKDLIPRPLRLESPTPAEQASIAQQIERTESVWGIYLICSLCLTSAEDAGEERQQNAELVAVRKIVLEAVSKSASSILSQQQQQQQHESSLDKRYGRFLAFGELCLRLLASRPAPANQLPASNNADDSVSIQIARIMMDTGFVGHLTSILAEIDLQHPAANRVISAVLKPLEVLTKVAIKIGRSGDLTGAGRGKHPAGAAASGSGAGAHGSGHAHAHAGAAGHRPPLPGGAASSSSAGQGASGSRGGGQGSRALEPSPFIVGNDMPSDGDHADMDQDDEEDPTANEISDMYRNSSLGMFSGEHPHGDEQSEEYEEGYEEFTDEDGSDMDMDGEESEEDDDMEIVVPEPYHGNEVDFTSSEDDHGHGETGDEMDSDDDDDVHDGEEVLDGDMSWETEDEDEDEDDDADDQDDHDALAQAFAPSGDESDGDDEDDDQDDHDAHDDGDAGGAAHGHGHNHAAHGHLDGQGEFYEDVADEDDEEDEDNDEDIFDMNAIDMAGGAGRVGGDAAEAGFVFPEDAADAFGAGAATGAGGRRRAQHGFDMPMFGYDIMGDGLGRGGGFADSLPVPAGLDDFQVLGRQLGLASRANAHTDAMTHPLLVNRRTPMQGGLRTMDGALDMTNMGMAIGGPGGHRHILDFSGNTDMETISALQQMLTRGGLRRDAEIILPSGEGGLADMASFNRLLRMLPHGSLSGRSAHAGGHRGGAAHAHGATPAGHDAAGGSKAAAHGEDGAPSVLPSVAERLGFLHSHSLALTDGRWRQESRAIYGALAQEKALRVVNAILNRRMPAALEEERVAKEKAEAERKARAEAEEAKRAVEEAARKKREAEEAARREAEAEARRVAEEAARREAEERAAAEAAAAAERAAAAAASAAQQPTDMNAEPTSAAESSSAAPAEPERVVVIIHGNPVDITGTGIDVTFLEALPDDLRQEVVTQHLEEQRRAQMATEATGNISLEFLEALPFEIREEVIRQERLEAERRQQQQQAQAAAQAAGSAGAPAAPTPAAAAPHAPVRGIPPLGGAINGDGFLAALQSQLRDAVLGGPDPMLLNPATAAGGARSQLERLLGRAGLAGAGGIGAGAAAGAGAAVPRSSVTRETAQLVDKSGVVNLLRLVFLPEPVSSQVLTNVLTNLNENSKTRADVLTLLLGVLVDGSADLAAVDRGFSQLSLKGKGKASSQQLQQQFLALQPSPAGSDKLQQNQVARKPSTSAILSGVSQAASAIPNLVAQRCLETLLHLINSNNNVVRFFLAENEAVDAQLARNASKTPRKGKGKEKEKPAPTYRYPVVVLLSLLERRTFLENSSIMEQLMQVLTNILRLLPVIVKKNAAAAAVASATATATATPAAATAATEAVPTPETAGAAAGSSSAGPSAAPATPVKTAAPADKPSTDHEFKTPFIPEQYIRNVINVLKDGVCSSKTFNYTLTVIQYLTSIPENYAIISRELVGFSQQLGDVIIPDLTELSHAAEQATSSTDITNALLAKFSSPVANQSKLLRLLKTIDFICSKPPASQAAPAAAEAKAGAAGPSASTGTAAAAAAAAAAASATAAGSTAAPSALTIAQNPELAGCQALAEVCEQFNFRALWRELGSCLHWINQKPDLVHAATVLLPLIESFMVVSKPSVLLKKAAAAAAAAAASAAAPGASTAGALGASAASVAGQAGRSLIRQASETPSMLDRESFASFTDEHKKVLNTMVRNNPSLMSGSFSLLVHNPKVLEFDNKRTYFTQQLHKKASNFREHYGTLSIHVRRQYVFEDSFHQLSGRSGDELKYGKLSVRFYEEEGVDAGGVTREWFSVLARQMFNPDYALFRPSAADKVTYQPNRTSGVNPDHLLYFKFVGRIIGKAIFDGRLLDAYFTRSFYKCILGSPVEHKDMEAIDPEYHKSLEWILENDITDVLDLTFSTEVDDFGRRRIIDLKPNGRNLPVTEENKVEYVKLITEQRLVAAIKAQIDAFLAGFHEVIPRDLISIFNEQELELLISGMPDIDIDDWKNNTEYQNYTPTSPQVQWFWRVVRSLSQEERAKLIQFVTGTSKVPLEGFKALQGSTGVQKFQIHKDFGPPTRLPSAHTCFNQIDVPQYESYEQLRAMLLTALNEGVTGFGFA